MTTLLHLSDTHFGVERPEVVDAFLRWASANPPIDVLVLSGDLTQRARRDEFERARALVACLAPRACVAVPGNHDLPLFKPVERLLAPYGEFERAFGAARAPCLIDDALAVFGVDSTVPLRHRNGRVGRAARAALLAALAAAPAGALKVVVAHHPVDCLLDSDHANLMHGAHELVREGVAAGARLFLGGHIHHPFIRPLAARHGEPAGDAWVMQAGTAVSRRLRAGQGNSFNRLVLEPVVEGTRRVALERWDYRDEGAGFVLAERHEPGWTLARA
ncbi:3',5'-cyclic AMP phosphodiesterase CpdA [Crenobacter luteus]|uniref:metallophosphoesterase family protein n=1 Tax=Crenobacter luteus TaxID=1452487 RepID=UPI001051C132|nr:metallophosphoesterase [Crenobacter luteus]TCP11254.1 3',5'-cyclic AMP phosphodiesterase CpdA [Crenobacter luteus]